MIRSGLLVAGQIEHPAVFAKRLVGSPAGHVFWDSFGACVLMMTFTSTPATSLRLLALISFVVGQLLAVVALPGSLLLLKLFDGAPGSSCVEVSLSKKSSCIGRFLRVHNNRFNVLHLSVAIPSYLNHLCFIFSC